MNTTKTILGCVVVLAITLITVWVLHLFKSEPMKAKTTSKPRIVNSVVVRSISKRIDVETHGTVKPRTDIQLIAQVSGVAMTVSSSLETGGFFGKDETLLQLDDRDYKFEVIRAKAQVAQARVRLSLEEAEAEVARQEWDALGKGKATPLTLREPQVLDAKAALAAAEASHEKAKLALARTTIRAPFAGRVWAESVDVGQFVAQGSTLARIYAVDYAEVRLPLHDSKIKYLELPLNFHGSASSSAAGRELPTVTLRARFAQEMQEWSARIVRTEGEMDPKSRMVHAVARIRDPYGRLDSSNGDPSTATRDDRPPLAVGMFVEGIIHGRTFDGVFEVPRDAIRNDRFVLIIDDESRMHERPIKVLHRGESSVVVEEGLKDGERICVSPISVFFENMRVQLATETPAANPSAAGNGSGK